MSFLDEVDSLKAKAGITATNPLVLVGVVAVVIAIAFVIGTALWSSFTSPGVVVEHKEEAAAVGAAEQAEPKKICVHVVGEVAKPGMYELDEGARVSDGIDAAGGMLEGADQLSINLARQLSDGEQVVVSPKVSPDASASTSSPSDAQETRSGAASGSNPSSTTGKVNINTASAAELTSLDGVGEATAAKIIAYRQANGSFSSIEEIKKVSGIGDKKFEALKDRITV